MTNRVFCAYSEHGLVEALSGGLKNDGGQTLLSTRDDVMSDIDHPFAGLTGHTAFMLLKLCDGENT